MKIKKPSLFVVGMILVIMQGVGIAGGAKFQTNPWDAPQYMSGNVKQVLFDMSITAGFLLFGIIGVTLILLSFRSHKEKQNKKKI